MTAFCAAADWGTSSFRLWLLSEDGEVLAERRSAEGMMQAAKSGFDAILERHLADVGADAGLPVVICGMAGARQGWQEAGYLDTPADLGEVARRAHRVGGHPRDVRILPGIAQRQPNAPDVMRGEETQLLGIRDQMPSGLVCMPGTHSKWVKLYEGAVESFATYLTGDQFAALADRSILSMAIDEAHPARSDDPAFLEAGSAAFANADQAGNLLFQIRSGQLLGFGKVSEGASRLSGILLGQELAGAMARFGHPKTITLIASGPLGDLYAALLEAVGLSVHSIDAENAARRGLWSAGRAFWSVEGG